jgi:tetratricopeptide (TPR) repeat protein
VNFAPDTDLLITSGLEATGQLWDPWSHRQLVTMPGAFSHFSRDGRRLASRPSRWSEKLCLWEVASGREYRALVNHVSSKSWSKRASISPDGRWLVTADSVYSPQIWDLALGQEAARLEISEGGGAIFQGGGAFITYGNWGLTRWPFQEQAGTLRIGPARILSGAMRPGPGGRPTYLTGVEDVSVDREGHTLAAILGPWGGYILNLKDPLDKGSPLDHRGASSVATSLDGRWVATGGPGVRIWEASSGQLIRELAAESLTCVVDFSPDRRWLVIGSRAEYGVWKTDSWTPIWKLPRAGGNDPGGVMAFSGDGKVLALCMGRGVVQLVEAATGQPLAVLEAPDKELINRLCFSPDGSQLVVVTNRPGGLCVWDLRLVRAQLAQIGLDWNLPAYPAPADAREAKPVRVEVDYGDWAPRLHHQRRGNILAVLGRWTDAIAEYTLAIEGGEKIAYVSRADAYAEMGQWDKVKADFAKFGEKYVISTSRALLCLALKDRDGYRKVCRECMPDLTAARQPLSQGEGSSAWLCLLAPDSGIDHQVITRWAERAVAVNPKNPDYLSMLGAAHYRAGQFAEGARRMAEADETYLESRMKFVDPPGMVRNRLFSCMVQCRLGRYEEARTWLRKAVQMIDSEQPKDRVFDWRQRLEWQLLRQEAEELLAKKD